MSEEMTDMKQPAQGDRKDNMGQILSANNLKYMLPTNLSVVNKRTQKINYADQNAYFSNTGNEINFRLTSSTDVVWGRNCYLRFDLSIQADVAGQTGHQYGFYQATACNLFDRILIESKDGSELDRIERLNQYVKCVKPYEWSRSYRTQLPSSAYYPGKTGAYGGDIFDTGLAFVNTGAEGSISGVNNSVASYSVTPNTLTTAFGTSLRVCIPMWMISGIFDTDRFIPSQLVSGMTLRLTLANANKALCLLSSPNATAINLVYQINTPVIVVDSYELAPMVAKKMAEASQGGLDFVYKAVYQQPVNIGAQQSVSIQVNKAVARALCVSVVSSDTKVGADAVLELPYQDSVGSGRFDYYQYQLRLGDIYIPQLPIQAGSTNTQASVQRNCAEFYTNNLLSLRKHEQTYDPCYIQFEQFASTIDPNQGTNPAIAGAGAGVVQADGTSADPGANSHRVALIQSLEKHATLEYDGLPVNNSRTLELRITYSDADVNRLVSAWLDYVKLAKVFPLRSVIKE